MEITTDKDYKLPSEVSTKVTFDRKVNLGEIGILKVSPNLQKIIDYLHYKIGAVEWSGILFYKLTKGELKNLKELEFTADFLYPMNIGSSGSTEFNYSGEIIDAYDIYQEGMEQSTGLVHSHHNMSTFFSPTDTSELEDNAGHYNFYISLIVNFAHEYCAKIAFPSKTTVISEFSIKDILGKLFKRKLQKEENTLLIGDLRVIIEGEVERPSWLETRVKVLEEKKATSIVSTAPFMSMDIGDEYPQYARNSSIYKDIGSTYTSGVSLNSNFKKDWSSQPAFNGLTKPIQSGAKFLSALVSLNHLKTDANLYQTFQNLNSLTENELTQFEVSIEANIELIHSAIYDSEIGLKKHCLEALIELVDYESVLGETVAYGIIYDILNSYV